MCMGVGNVGLHKPRYTSLYTTLGAATAEGGNLWVVSGMKVRVSMAEHMGAQLGM